MATKKSKNDSRYRRDRKPAKTKSTVKLSIDRARNTMFQQRVLSVLASSSESKVVNWRMPQTYVAPPASTEFGNGIYCISPSSYTYGGVTALTVNQGTGQGERIGNKISPVSVTFKGVVRPNPFFNVTTNYNPGPMYVVVWIVSLATHLTDDASTLESVIDNSFFQNGNVSTGISGLLVDLTQTVNTAHITVHKRRVFKIGFASYPSGTALAQPNYSGQVYNNNDFSLSSMFAMNLKFPNTIEFNDATTNPSSMKRWWYFAVPYRADGQYFVTNASSTAGPTPLVVDFAVEMKYKDM